MATKTFCITSHSDSIRLAFIRFHYIKTVTEPGENGTKALSCINNHEVSQYLESKEANIIIATDGSIRDTCISAWGGAVWQNNRKTFEWCAGKQRRTSSFRAESEAYEDALIWTRNNTTEEDRVVVLTDSLGLVARLKRGLVREHWVKTICDIKADYHTTYIPGNAGIWYNETADQLAGAAEPIGPM
ncbi:hypothetical protein OS493_014149 [Desmophyllum pertusum]|uniref:RNase H type-1 domain-containing protein n=1 Tax=Desmophyllum pertusum TaxID=174260 RepID=A0A9W9ZDM5_9CNID|nr:hypothetical protein OS493_014149 [Desmophyllum pertusum]